MTRPERVPGEPAHDVERKPAEPAPEPERALLALQHSAGNQAVGRYLARTRTQTPHGGRREARARTRERNRERDEKYELNHPPEEQEEEPEEDEETRFNRAYDDVLARFGAMAGVFGFVPTGEKPHFDTEFWTCTLLVTPEPDSDDDSDEEVEPTRIPWGPRASKQWRAIKKGMEIDFEYTLKSGKRPSAAIMALYEKPGEWGLDCIDFVVAARLYAECVAGGHAAFDRKYSSLGDALKPQPMRMAQHDTPGLATQRLWRREGQGQTFVVKPGDAQTPHTPGDHAAEDKLLATVPVGTRVMWTSTHEDADEDFENENTIKLGPDSYAAHPLGVKSAAGIRDEMVVDPEDDEEELTKEQRLQHTRDYVYLCEIEFYERR